MALLSPQKQEWVAAMNEEFNTMQERKVWDLVEKPLNANVLGCRWVYTIKKDESGKIVKYKSRLVAQGFRQVKGETFEEVYSPVVNFAVIRLFFTIFVCLNKWKHVQCDVKCAYLYAPLTETIFMKQPTGFEDRKNPDSVCRLRKAIYGLHQSGREWYFEVNRVLKEMGFKKFDWCNCAYFLEKNVVLLLYVDDIIIFGRHHIDTDKAVNLLKAKFDLKILGRTRKLLGVEFVEEGGRLCIHQHEYIDKICNNFRKFNFPISSLPIAKGVIYSKTHCPQTISDMEDMKPYPYRSLVGSLAFLAGRTRPDIAYAINIFSQFQENPGISHWNGLIKLLGYVSYTRDLKLDLSRIKNLNLDVYSDSDFASNRDDRTSMGGQIVLLDEVPIAWRAFKEKCVSLSSMEAEFIAMTDAAKELVWFAHIINDCIGAQLIGQEFGSPRMLADNKAAIDFVRSPVENHRTKHIDVRLFFIRDLVYDEQFKLQHVSSKSNYADIFTKPLSKAELANFKEKVFSRY